MTKYGSARIERKKFWDRMRMYGYVSGAIVNVVLIAYVFIGSPIFKVKKVEVVSASEIDKDSVIAAVKSEVKTTSGLMGPDSYFSWDTGATYTAPNVSSIKMEKSMFSRTVTLTVEPRQRFMVWCSMASAPDAAVGAGCFWVDQTGTLFEQAPATEGQLVQAVYDDAPDNQFALGQQILGQKEFDAVSKIFKSQVLRQIGINSISLSRSLEEITATTLGGTKLIFSIRFDPENSALPALAKFMENPGLSKLEYVNLTVENRAFVKYR